MDIELAKTFVEMIRVRGMTFQKARLTLEFAINILERLPIPAPGSKVDSESFVRVNLQKYLLQSEAQEESLSHLIR